MSGGSVSDLVRHYFAAYRSQDRKFVEANLRDDFTFTSPYDDRLDRKTYFERCWPNSERIRKLHIEKIFEQGDEAFVLYACELTSGASFRNVEFFALEGGKLKRVEVYFGDPPAGVPRERYADFLADALRS